MKAFKLKHDNVKIKPNQISSNKRQGFVRNHAKIKKSSIYVLRLTLRSYDLIKIYLGSQKNPRI